MGFDHHSLLLTLPSVMLHFYRKSEEAGLLPRGCALVSATCKACVVLSLDLEWPTGAMRYVGINCPSDLEVLNCFFPHGLSSFTFCSKFSFSFFAFRFHKYLYYLKWLLINFIVCFSLENTVMCSIDYVIALLYISREAFFMCVVIVVFNRPPY